MSQGSLRLALATARQAHYRLLAQSVIHRGHGLRMYTSTPRNRLKNFPTSVQTTFVPAPVTLFHGATYIHVPQVLNDIDCCVFDWLVAQRLRDEDCVFGAASSSLHTGRAAKKAGGRFILDRACPDIRVQQQFVREEALKLGAEFDSQAQWFVDRQVAEYEEADVILSPSNYSRSSFPAHIQEKAILVPLFGRAPSGEAAPIRNDGTFTVGVVGGSPLRKGYLYLLQAWKKLALPNARLLIRSGGDLKKYPAIEKLLSELPNVTIVGYVPNLTDFYHQCDAFVLPSIDDGFGMALFEALAHGLPCIATNHCGASELLTTEKDALIVNPYSAEELAEGLTRLYESPDLRARLGAQGRATVASMQDGERARPYEEGIDRLFERLAATA